MGRSRSGCVRDRAKHSHSGALHRVLTVSGLAGPGTESVSQTRAAAQNRLLAVPFQQDIVFMHIHVANDHYRHASQTTKSSCGAPTADRRVSEAATGPRSQLPGGRYVHGVEVTSRIRPWRRMNANGACQFGEGGGGARQHDGRREAHEVAREQQRCNRQRKA